MHIIACFFAQHFRYWLALALLIGVGGTHARAGELRAALSTNEAYVNSPVQYTIQVSNAREHEPPSFPEIDGVAVRSLGSPRKSSRISIINGHRSQQSSVVYQWQIIPRREGTFTIPAISVSVDGRDQKTRPMRLSVVKSETDDLLFAEIVGNEEQIFVGQPMDLMLKIWIRPFSDAEREVSLSEGNMWQLLSMERSQWGIFAERLEELAENRQRPGGREVLRKDAEGVERRYFLYEIDATVYPKRPGQIDGQQVQIVVDYPTRLGKSRDPFRSLLGGRGFPSMFGDDFPSMLGERLTITATRPITAGAEVHATDVLPIPTAGRPADYQGAVGNYLIVTKAGEDHVKAGDPIRLRLAVQGDGPMDLVQAPPLSRIPELVERFKVDDSALPGVVRDNVKLFTASIRPRNEQVTEIPAIPFSFFDPDAKKFVTVKSQPVPIQVDPADQLSFDSIVGGSASGESEVAKNSDAEDAMTSRFQFENTTSPVALAPATPAAHWPGWVAICLPPLLFFAVRGRRIGGALLKPFRSVDPIEDWLQRIRNAATVREIALVFEEFLRKQAAGSASDPSHAVVSVDTLLERVDPETARLVRDVLTRCQSARFGGETADRRDGLSPCNAIADDAAACVRQVAQQLTSPQPVTCMETPRRSARTWRDVSTMAAGTSAVLAGWVLWSGFGQTCWAIEWDDAQRLQVFSEANAAYAEGRDAAPRDAAESKQSFEQAIDKYQALIDSGVVNDRLYFNLGNACMQIGAVGRAIANYESSLAIRSRRDARINLKLARKRLVERQESADAGAMASPSSRPSSRRLTSVPVAWFRSPGAWFRQWPTWLLTTIRLTGVFAWTLVWVLGGFTHRVPRGIRNGGIATCLFIAVLCATSVYINSRHRIMDRVVVTAPTVSLRAGSGESFDASSVELREGDTCDVLQTRGDWLRVAAPDGSGWLPVDTTCMIARGSR